MPPKGREASMPSSVNFDFFICDAPFGLKVSPILSSFALPKFLGEVSAEWECV